MDLVPVGRGGSRGRGRGFRLDSRTSNDALEITPLTKLKATPSSDQRPVSVVDNNLLRSETQTVTSTLGNASFESGYVGSSSLPTGSDEKSGQPAKVGTRGIRHELLTNFVKLTKTREAPVYQYNVSFNPHVDYSKFRKRLMKQLEPVIGPVHNCDGHILYLPKPLPNEITVITCVHPADRVFSEVKVTVKFVKEKPVHELLQFYDLLLQKVMAKLGFLRIKNGFYETANEKEVKGQKLKVWPGVWVTVEYKDAGLMVMVDTVRRVLRTDTVLDLYLGMLEKDPDNLKEAFTDFIVGKIVWCKYNLKCYKIDDVDWTLNPLSEFKYRAGMIKFKDYFKSQYGAVLENLEQPMLISRIKPRGMVHPGFDSLASSDCVKTVALIPELCTLSGLTVDQRNNQRIMTDIRTLTKLDPTRRMGLIKILMDRIMNDPDAKIILDDWGLQVEREPIMVEGRLIKPPSLQFNKAGKGVLTEPNFSKYASSSCYDPIEIKNFLVLCTKYDRDKAVEFIGQYKEACATVGIRVYCNPNLVVVNGKSPSEFVDKLRTYCTDYVQFVLIICPNHQDDLFRAIKVQCTNVTPVPSQCILARTIQHKHLRKIAVNVALQINCKLGGSAWALRNPMKKVMFIGMDAAHDPNRRNPSVIALIATLNDSCTRFFSKPCYQAIHQEIATTLKTMFIDALHAYRKENGGELPNRIVFFRDGGSAGTFETLKAYEVETCLEVLNQEQEKTGTGKKVHFSYVCVAKRIPQRIMKCVGLKGGVVNPIPGTVVDTVITQPHLYDFYIVSQLVTQGTATPTHYTVLYETSQTPPDVMQKMAYSLTYMYFNYQGTIKVPAVIQYAHKLGQFCSRTRTLPSRELQQELYYL